MLDFETALERLLAAARPTPQIDSVPLSAALNRVLAAPLAASLDVPGFDNSAMDGYAIHVADFAAPPASFTLNGRIAAGEVGAPLLPNQAARIFTGAPIPAGANAVAMQEDCSVTGDQLRVASALKAQQNIRRRGEDIAQGQTILDAGKRLNPAMLGLAASIGAPTLQVYRPLRVALLSTGNELVEPGNALGAGQIYNSNRYALLGLLQAAGCQVSDLGIVPDNLAATRSALAEAAAQHDLVITSGGVSVGEEDHVKAALQELGQLDLWQIGIKPGKPFALGRIGEADFIGLPGNPVSAFVTFVMLAQPFIQRRQGVAHVRPIALPLVAAFDWPKADKRRNFLRARLNAAGQVELFPRQGSGVLTSMVWASALVDIAPGQTIKAGDVVSYIPLAKYY